MKMRLCALGCVLVLLNGCAGITRGEHDYFVEGSQLFKGKSSFTMRAVQVPDLGNSGGALSAMVPAMSRIAEVGGNTVCFDIGGVSADGTAIDPVGPQTVTAFADRAKDQRMYVLVRVPAALGETGVRTVAQALQAERRAVYWIDGENAAALADAFHAAAPDLVVAAREGGDVRVIHNVEQAPTDAPVLLVGTLPDLKTHDVSFVLEAKEESYAALEEALKTEEERAVWTPDNSVLREAERNEGFIALFNGKDLSGWWFFGDNHEGFKVRDGMIEWVEDGAGAIMTVNRYDNFILRLDYKIGQGNNSGVFLRAPRAARQSKIGMEFQLHGDAGTQPGDDMTGAIYTVVAPRSNPSRAAGEWNNLEIICDGPKLKATLNGSVIQDLDLDQNEELKYRLRNGFIGLQDHHEYVAFKNVRIKPL